MAEYTGPIGPSDRDWFVWFRRFVDFANPIHQRKLALIVHPDDESLVRDALERIIDEADEWPHDTVPELYVHASVPKGQVRPFDPDAGKILTMADVNKSRTGFGRWGGLWTPRRDGLTDPFRVRRDG